MNDESSQLEQIPIVSCFQHNLLDLLLLAHKSAFLADFDVSFNDHSISCHKCLLTPFSERMSSLVAKNLDSYEIDALEEATCDDFDAIISSFYGKALEITSENSLGIFLLSKSLKYKELSTKAQTVIKSTAGVTHKLPLESIMETLKSDNFKYHTIIFQDKSLQIHKFLFAAISPYFKTKFSQKWQESEDNFTDFTEFLKVSP
ncbi:hypothetical protein RCL1_001115 [Eukaryota sp. TZLM3-RCL]